jgi:hypothetical protein
MPRLQGNTDPLEQAVGKLQRTKRPDRADLAALLPELQVQLSGQSPGSPACLPACPPSQALPACLPADFQLARPGLAWPLYGWNR